MDTVEWNPGEIITGVHTASEENDEESCSTEEDVFNKDEELQQKEKLHSEEEMAHHFELIRRRQSQYTPVDSPVLARSPTVESTNIKEKRPLFCTSLEDGVEM